MPVNAFGGMVSIYFKPSMGRPIMRKPGSNQTSTAVKAAQMRFAEKMKGRKIASACKGKKWKAFVGCLRTEGYKAMHG